MKKDNNSTPFDSTDDDSKGDLRIKMAGLLPDPESRLNSTLVRYKPISDFNIPYRDLTNSITKRESFALLINKLDVANSIRYQKTIEDTYCNVYAYDYCYFSRVYLPCVWWVDDALRKILDGEDLEAIFEETVDVIYSSAIHDWFLEWGAAFGWRRMLTLDEIQNEVNANGGVGIICAKRKQIGLSGHIVPVVPETDENKAYRENGVVVYPLQSQAGTLNLKYFSDVRKDWWNEERYSSHVFYYHD